MAWTEKSSAAPVGRASASPSPMRQAGTQRSGGVGRAEGVRGLFDDTPRRSRRPSGGGAGRAPTFDRAARAPGRRRRSVEGAHGAASRARGVRPGARTSAAAGAPRAHPGRGEAARAADVATKLCLEERGGAARARAWAADMEAFRKGTGGGARAGTRTRRSARASCACQHAAAGRPRSPPAPDLGVKVDADDAGGDRGGRRERAAAEAAGPRQRTPTRASGRRPSGAATPARARRRRGPRRRVG